MLPIKPGNSIVLLCVEASVAKSVVDCILKCGLSSDTWNRLWRFALLVHLKGDTPKPYTTQCKNKNACWIGEHLDAYTIQKIGARE